MHSKVKFSVGLAAALLLLAGCDLLLPTKPVPVAKAFIQASIDDDYGRMYALLTTEEQGYKSEAAFEKWLKGHQGRHLGKPFSSLSHITTAEVTKPDNGLGRTTVTVTWLKPDFDRMMSEVPGADQRKWEQEPDKVQRLFRKHYADLDAVPMWTVTSEIDLVKEGGAWRVSAHLKELDQDQAKRSKAADLMSKSLVASDPDEVIELIQQAYDLTGDPNTLQALEKAKAAEALRLSMKAFDAGLEERVALLGKAAKLRPDDTGIVDRLSEALTKLEHKRRVRAYVGKLGIVNLKSDYYPYGAPGVKVPGVTFEVRNNGDEALSKVAATIEFLGSAGEVLGAKKWDVFEYKKGIRPGSIAAGLWSPTPLMPGQTSARLSEDKAIQFAPEVLNSWKPGDVRIRIDDIGFIDKPDTTPKSLPSAGQGVPAPEATAPASP